MTSAVVADELESAPGEVQDLFNELLTLAETVSVSEEAAQLQNAYLQAGIVGPRGATDALHIALATLAGCSLVVSWNFKHLVHFEKITQYNAVNTLKRYASIGIFFSVGGDRE